MPYFTVFIGFFGSQGFTTVQDCYKFCGACSGT